MNNIKETKWLFVLISYLFITIVLNIYNATLFVNIINPLIWLLIIFYLIKSKKISYFKTNLNNRNFLYIVIMLILFIFIYYYMGLKFGFTISPYSHDFLDVLKNLIVTIVPIIGIEWLRNILIVKNKNNRKNLIVLLIIFVLIQIDYNVLNNSLSNHEELFKYICSNVFPIIAGNILYIYLIVNNVYILPLILRILVKLIFILTPIIPSINWFLQGSIELITIGFVYVFFKCKFIKSQKKFQRKKEKMCFKVNSIFMLSLGVALISFMLGAFKYEPIAILSNSMVPTMSRGDVVIFKKLSEEELSNIPIGTIIIYKSDGKNISHRVVKRYKSNNKIVYITKGDNNKGSEH